MQKTRSNSYLIFLTLILSLNFGILFFDRNAINFLMPFVARDLGLTFTQIGLLASALSLTWALAGMVVGRWSDRAGRKKIFIVAAGVIFSLCSFVSGLATGFLSLIAARLLMGAAEGMVLPVSHALVAKEVPPERRGLAMGITQNLGSCFFGAFLAPVLLPALADAFGWRTAFYIAGVPGLICAAVIWFLVHEPERQEEAGSGERIALRDMLRQRNMILCMGIAITMVSYLVITMAFMPLYLATVLRFDPQGAGWLMGLLGISAALGSFAIPAMSDRIGRRPVMIVAPLLGLLIPLGVLFSSGAVSILAPLFFVGWALNGIFPLFMGTIPSETLPPREVATAAGLVMGVGEIFGGVGSPFLAGWASDRVGLQAALWILAALAVLAGAMGFALTETAPGRVNSGHSG